MKKVFLVVLLLLFTTKLAFSMDYSKIKPNEYVLGNRNAKVQVIVYSSLSCPHCANFYTKTFPLIQQAYIDSGKIAFVNRTFMTDRIALASTMLAYCQPNPEDNFKMIKVLYKHFDHWLNPTDYIEKLEKIAALAGISQEKFQSCQNNEDVRDHLLREQKEASEQLHIEYIPSIFINGKMLTSSYNFDNISKMINQELSNSK